MTKTFTCTDSSPVRSLLTYPFPRQQPPPFPSSDKPCELYCSPLGKESPLLVADRVLDGTPCGPYETDLCVYGRCQVTCFSYCPGWGCGERFPLPHLSVVELRPLRVRGICAALWPMAPS